MLENVASLLGLSGARSTAETSFALLVGPPRCGLSSLSFECARDFASSGQRVWFMCLRDKFERSLPARVIREACADADTEAPELELIHMKYVNSLSDIKWWCLRVQEIQPSHPLPAVLVFDDLDALILSEAPPSSEVVQRTVLHTVALLKHAAAFISSRGARCKLLLALSESSAWFKDVWFMLERELERNTHAVKQVGPGQFALEGPQFAFKAAFAWTPASAAGQAYFQIQPIQP